MLAKICVPLPLLLPLTVMAPPAIQSFIVNSSPLSLLYYANHILFENILFYFNWRIIVYSIVLVSATHQHESASAIVVHLYPPF